MTRFAVRATILCRHAVLQPAQSNVTVLIAGESGTGRRLVARTIHDRLPDVRLESELFGDVPGADGRASQMVCGRLEAAHGGTLVLQDVGYLSWRLQGRLMRHTDARSPAAPPAVPAGRPRRTVDGDRESPPRARRRRATCVS